MYYIFQLGQGNSVLCHCYYQNLPNWIQNPIFIWEQDKPTLFQDMYTLAMTINHYYYEHDHKYYYTRQAEKEAFKSYSQKQGKASFAGNVIASQNKASPSPMALSTKSPLSKLFLFHTLKKQSNSLQVDFFSKLASNSKLTSNKHKKCLENNLHLYCSTGDHKLDSCSKKQTTVTFKGYSTLATANSLTVTFEKTLEKQRTTSRTLYRLKAMLNFPIQQQVLFDSTYLLFLILIYSLSLLLLS